MQAFILMIGPAGFMVVLQPTTKLNILMKIYLMLLQLHCIFCYLTFPRGVIKTVYIYVPHRDWVSKQVAQACFFFLRPGP